MLKTVSGLMARDIRCRLSTQANPLVFIHASSFGMKGTESPAEIEADKGLMRLIERIRGEACVMIGLVDKPEDAATKTPYQPFFAIVSEPADYQTISGSKVKAADVDLVSRLLFMLRMHKTYPVTGTVCTGAAVRIPGTIAYEVLREEAKSRMTVQIGHPGGVIPVEAEASYKNDQVKLTRIGVYRTARRIMDGYVYVRKSVFK